MNVAFIGTRQLADLDQDLVQLYKTLASAVSLAGHTIVTGAAPGCDQLAAALALEEWGKVRLVLPWNSYEADWVGSQVHEHRDRVEVVVYDKKRDTDWAESVPRLHPAFDKLSEGAKALHARNYGIVKLSNAVVALDSEKGGGAGQGMRVARELGMPCYDLRLEDHRTVLAKWLKDMT